MRFSIINMQNLTALIVTGPVCLNHKAKIRAEGSTMQVIYSQERRQNNLLDQKFNRSNAQIASPYQQVESISDIYRIEVIRASRQALPVLAGSHGEVPAHDAFIRLVYRTATQTLRVAALPLRIAGLAVGLAHLLTVLAVPAQVFLEIFHPS